MSAEEPQVIDDFFKPATWQNPYPAYSTWRDRSPFIARIPFVLPDGSDLEAYSWLVLKHDEVYGVLRDHETFSSDFPAVPNGPPRLPLIQDDPPRHAVFRRIVNKAFTARRIAQLEPWIRETAEELITAMGAGEADVIAGLGIPLPVRVIARLLGIPGSDYLTFKRWSDSFMVANARAVDPESRLRNGSDMAGYFGRVAAERRTQGAEDLVTALVEAEVDGERLAEAQLLGFCTLLLIAGNETTTNLIGNLLNLLATRPELWRRLRENRALVEGAIEEALRYESPVQVLYRWVRRDTEIAGRKIFPNTVVAVGFGSANRDPLAFPHADEFDIERDWTRHLAFGSGIHYCLGAPLARVESTIALNALLDRYETLAPASRPGIRQSASNVIFGFTQLPLRFGG
ncbi:MAG TPA: cytochrome P450 [Candidatus Binataceae bacterium]|nr:cytochrome P450 [Candidatus Binataceae bacterium]